MTGITRVKFLDDVGSKYKKGDEAVIPDDILAVMDKKKFKRIGDSQEPTTDGPENLVDSKTVKIGDVKSHMGDYVILESDKAITISLLSDDVVQNHYKDDETGREWDRYELQVLHNEKITKILLPVSVVDSMYKQIVANGAENIETAHPKFLLSKTGEGKKTKYSTIYTGKGA